MRVMLVVKTKVMENLGVMYISSVVQRAGHECWIVSLPEMVGSAHEWKPDIIGLSIMTGDQDKFHHQVTLLKTTHKWKPTIILGGPHPTFFPEDCCEWSDVILPGEVENEISELLGSGHRYPDLDSIPWPDRKDFPGMVIRDFISSRGCPHDCHYCYNDRWNKLFPEIKKVRTRSVKDVIAEVSQVAPKFAYFQDSCFAVSMRWMLDFADLYSRKVNIPYHCHLRPDQVTEDRAKLLKKSNCYSTRIALETASDRLRKLINRAHTTNEETYTAAENLRKYGIKLMVQNILCLPTSTIEDDLHTLEVNIITQPDYAWCSIFVPYPGTVLGDLCIQNGWYKGDYEDITDSFFDHSVLDISPLYREQSYYLQKVFALCVKVKELPKPEELTAERFPGLVHRLMRKDGDNILYGGVI